MRDFKDRKRPSRSSEQFFKPTVQTKLSMGSRNDAFEAEADSMADKVVNQKGGGDVQRSALPGEENVQQKPLADSISSVQLKEMPEEEPVQKKEDEQEAVQKKDEEEAVQKKEEEEPIQKKEEEQEAVQKKEEEEPVQKKEEEEVQKKEDEEPVQKKDEEEPVQKKDEEEPVQKKDEEEPVQKKPATAAASTASPGVEGRLRASKGKGTPMDSSIRGEMERGFGADFSNVNVHTDSEANQLSNDLGAQAFTNGGDIYFNEGKYDPDSKAGKTLLAHELTHTIQQGAAGSAEKEDGQVQRKTDHTLQRSSKKLNDHDKGFLDVKNDNGQRYPLSYNAEVDYKEKRGGREYFTAQEWPHRGEKSSVKGEGRFITGAYNGPAKVEFWKSRKLLKFGNGIKVKAYSVESSPIATGKHELMLPDYPHPYGYLEDSEFSYAWFRIGENETRYLHIGSITAGCITIGANETGAPEDRKKWSDIYKYLINCRAGDNRSVGTITVYD